MKHLWFTICMLLAGIMGPAQAAEKFLFIPLDNRPVSLSYTADSFRRAGYDVVTPPAELVASDTNTGNPEGLAKWLEQEAAGASGAVVSGDALLYGGLVNSRTHHLPEKTLEQRAHQLLAFKKKHPDVPLYAFSTIMRSPRWSGAPVEPAYYSQYGPQLFRWGQLRDKQELGVLKKKESRELADLEQALPEEVRKDLLDRRAKNRRMLVTLAEGLKSGALDYFLIGRDDSAAYSEAHRDARHFMKEVKDVPSYKLRSFAGADELGMVLLNRAVNKARGRTPLVYSYYPEGTGKATVPSYEDNTVEHSYREHVLAAGAYPAQFDKRADLVLALHTPVDGVTYGADGSENGSTLAPEQERFLHRTEQYLSAGKNVGMADVAFGNGGSNALVKALLDRGDAYKLGSYAGWNTASNSLGYALGQGLLRPTLPDGDREALLSVRYLDDWAYQSNVRQQVRKELIWANQWPDGKLDEAQTKQAEEFITDRMQKTAIPYMGKERVKQFAFRLPWKRTFEVEVKKIM